MQRALILAGLAAAAAPGGYAGLDLSNPFLYMAALIVLCARRRESSRCSRRLPSTSTPEAPSSARRRARTRPPWTSRTSTSRRTRRTRSRVCRRSLRRRRRVPRRLLLRARRRADTSDTSSPCQEAVLRRAAADPAPPDVFTFSFPQTFGPFFGGRIRRRFSRSPLLEVCKLDSRAASSSLGIFLRD